MKKLYKKVLMDTAKGFMPIKSLLPVEYSYKRAFRNSVLENSFSTEETLQEIPCNVAHGKDILSEPLGRQVWWCDLALVLEQSLAVRAEGLGWSQTSPSQLFPGRLLSRRHMGDPECQQWDPGGRVEVYTGFAETHIWVGWEKWVLQWTPSHR